MKVQYTTEQCPHKTRNQQHRLEPCKKNRSSCGRYDKWIQNLQYIHLKPAKVCAGVFTLVVCSVIVSDELRAKDLCKSNASMCTASFFWMSAMSQHFASSSYLPHWFSSPVKMTFIVGISNKRNSRHHARTDQHSGKGLVKVGFYHWNGIHGRWVNRLDTRRLQFWEACLQRSWWCITAILAVAQSRGWWSTKCRRRRHRVCGTGRPPHWLRVGSWAKGGRGQITRLRIILCCNGGVHSRFWKCWFKICSHLHILILSDTTSPQSGCAD